MNTCDKCGPSVAASWIVFLNNGPLTFCRHHWREYARAFVLKYRFTELQSPRDRRFALPIRRRKT